MAVLLLRPSAGGGASLGTSLRRRGGAAAAGRCPARAAATWADAEPAKVRCRRVTARDWNKWKPLWDGYCEFYNATVPEEVARNTWRRLCDEGDGAMFCLVALSAGDGGQDLAGFATVVVHPTTFCMSDDVYLEDLYVLPEERGRGCGGALVEAVKQEAEALGARKVYWHTEEGNAVARKLYDRVGTLTDFVKYEAPLLGCGDAIE